jgi:hypothetical protein
VITIIVPLYRPRAAARVWRCFCRQSHERRRLVIVENGPAVGACARFGIRPDALLRSTTHKVAALNTGLHWLRKHGGGPWAIWDDDDYYGPGYLAEMSVALRTADIVGKPSLFVRRSDGSLWLFRREGQPLGHSFGGHSDCIDFTDCGRWGEDDRWLNDMLAVGAKLGCTGPENFIWWRLRQGGHMWPADDMQVAQSLWRTGGVDIHDYGEAPNSVVDGERADSRLVALPPFDFVRDVVGVPQWAMQCAS